MPPNCFLKFYVMVSPQVEFIGMVHMKVEFIPVPKMGMMPILGRFVWTIYFVKYVHFEWNHAKVQWWWLYSWRRFRFGTRRQKTYNKDFSFHDPRTNLTINCILPRESLKTKIANSFAQCHENGVIFSGRHILKDIDFQQQYSITYVYIKNLSHGP